MIILQTLLAFIYMCIVPYLIGRAIMYGKDEAAKVGVPYTLVTGLMISYALYEVLALGLQKLGFGFRTLSAAYLLIVLLLAAVGIVCVYKERSRKSLKKLSLGRPDGYMIAAFVLIAVQIGAILFMATPDMDDAFYSGLSSMSLAKDYILEFDAYSGTMTRAISKRYMVSALPVFQASLSLYTGMHHLVITHNLFPLFYMPLAYAVYYRMGKRFLQREGIIGAEGKFLFVFALMHMIGNYYVFSPENFLVTRMWQGKALFVALGIPALWLCGQSALFADEKKMRKSERIKVWLLVATALLASTFMGETGLFLGPFLLGCQTLAACIITKKWKKIIPAAVCCIPEAVLFFVYLL